MSYKTTDALMRYLRGNGITISGGRQKRQLINTGYFHGYKGYRFFNKPGRILPFTDYKDVIATIEYDSEIKRILYPQVMYIETAVKNIALECILNRAKSENLQQVFERVISGYHNAPANSGDAERRKLQAHKLKLRARVQGSIHYQYEKQNPVITHYYNKSNRKEVPIWALFEIMTMGDFGYLLSCMDYDTRDAITRAIGFNIAFDSNRDFIYKYVYLLKDLRNAIAHNGVVYDTRFKEFEPKHSMKECLRVEFGLPYVNFKTIGDYVILICYYLKLLKVPKRDIKRFIGEFEKATRDYKGKVAPAIAAKTIHADLLQRLNILCNSL